MPSPIWNGWVNLPNTPSSCCQITRSIGVAPRPPYSFGHCRQAQPPSAFFFCQALPTSTMSWFCSRMRPSDDFDSSASSSLGALASTHLRAVVRNSSSCGVSSKFMAGLSHVARALRASLGRYLVERHVLVDPDIAGQAEHALGDDIAHDLVGAALDAGAGLPPQYRLEFAGELRPLAAEHTGRTLQIHRVHRDILHHRPRHQLADG